MKLYKILPWLLISIIIGFKLIESYLIPKRIRESGSTSYNDRNVGLSMAHQYFQTQGKDYQIFKKAFLKIDELSSLKTLIIAAPLFSLSERESRILQEFVRKGGNLVLLVATRESYSLFGDLLRSLNISTLPIEENPSFENKKTESVKYRDSNFIFRSDEEYSVYSSFQFQNDKCSRDSRGDCFTQYHVVGSGQVSIFLGVPFLSNTMLQRGQNSHLAFRLNRDFGPLGIDEYHHLFSQYTFYDLLKLPQFAFPMLGFLLLMIAYFFFARSRLHDHTVSPKDPVLTLGFHHLSQNVVAAQIQFEKGLGAGLKIQAKALSQIYPQFKNEIQNHVVGTSNFQKNIHKNSQDKTWLSIMALLRFHKNQLARLRGTKK